MLCAYTNLSTQPYIDTAFIVGGPNPVDPYAVAVLATADLAGYWKLGEARGILAVDYSGQGYHLLHAGSVTLDQAKLVPATVDRATDYAGSGGSSSSRAVVPNFQSANVITLECWVNGDANGNICPMGLFGSATDKGIWINFANPSTGVWASLDGSAQTLAEDTAPNNFTTNYHIVATHDGTNLKLYINGSLVATTALSGSLHAVTTSGGMALGKLGAASSDFFNGRVDEAAIYKRALTLSEVQAHYAAGIGPAGPIRQRSRQSRYTQLRS